MCAAGCLPRKELFETWEAARVISDVFGHRMHTLRVLDLAAGHGLLAHLLLILHPEVRTCKPQTPNPKPQTLNPKPQTPNPKPQTPNPKPQTPNSKP